jgi:hypothetical protein
MVIPQSKRARSFNNGSSSASGKDYLKNVLLNNNSWLQLLEINNCFTAI